MSNILSANLHPILSLSSEHTYASSEQAAADLTWLENGSNNPSPTHVGILVWMPYSLVSWVLMVESEIKIRLAYLLLDNTLAIDKNADSLVASESPAPCYDKCGC